MSPRLVKWLWVGGVTLAVFVSLAATTAVVAAKWYENRILPNTVVAGVSMSGKTLDEAKSLITQQAITVTTQPLTLTLGETTANTTASELGLTIDEDQTFENLSQETDPWVWTGFSYWRNFFRAKNQALAYTLNEEKLTATLNEKFPVSTDPVDAAIVVNNGSLETTLSQNGITIDLQEFKNNISTLVASAASSTLQLKYTEVPPSVNNDEANRVKTEIATTLQPVYLATTDYTYTISANDLMTLISYTKEGTTLKWQVDSTQAQNYLKAKVSAKLNVKMLQKITLSTTGEITQQGRDGKTVDTASLAAAIITSVTTAAHSSVASPINIPITTTAFTEKTVYPGFTVGLYPGKYLMIDLSDQKMYLIEGNTKVGEYSVSSGKWSTPTPTGTFYIANKSGKAYSRPFNLWMPYWNGFALSPDGSGNKGYGIHGLPCFNKECTLIEGASHIGTPVSHGCVRLPAGGDALVYDWAPIGTPVVIEK